MDAVILGSAILGGLILNVMPCVLPVLFFKINGLIEHRDIAPRQRRIEGLAYLGGTLAAVSAFAVAVILLGQQGVKVNQGQQMSNPAFVGGLIIAVYFFGLNAAGLFHINLSFGGGGGGTPHGAAASFRDGLLITLVSTPCSAPILGTAMGAALALSNAWWETLIIFWLLGFGLALPVLAICFIPGLNRLLPKPGAWMETFKVLVGFTFIGTAIWLYSTFKKLVSAGAATDFLWILFAITVCMWAIDRMSHSMSPRKRHQQAAVFVATLAVGFWMWSTEEATEQLPPSVLPTVADGKVPDTMRWTPFTLALRDQALKRKQPVFVDFTADWCVNCKLFEKTHINVHAIRKTFAETGILAAKADLTKNDDALWKVVNDLGRDGLPVYVIFTPDGQFDLFDEGPPTNLEARLRAAAKRFPPGEFAALN